MSKENKTRKKQTGSAASSKNKTPLAIRPVGQIEKRRRKSRIRFYILLAIWVIALAVALLFVTGKL